MAKKPNGAKTKKSQTQEQRQAAPRFSQLLLALPKLLEEAGDECFDYCVDDVWPPLEWYHLSRLLEEASKTLNETLQSCTNNAVLSEHRDKEMRSGNGNGVTVNAE
jgi:hypothetical protein